MGLLFSLQAGKNIERIMRYLRYSHTRRIRITSVRHHLVQLASSFNDCLVRTKGGTARAFTSTNDEAQAPFSP